MTNHLEPVLRFEDLRPGDRVVDLSCASCGRAFCPATLDRLEEAAFRGRTVVAWRVTVACTPTAGGSFITPMAVEGNRILRWRRAGEPGAGVAAAAGRPLERERR